MFLKTKFFLELIAGSGIIELKERDKYVVVAVALIIIIIISSVIYFNVHRTLIDISSSKSLIAYSILIRNNFAIRPS